MKSVDLSTEHPSLAQILDMARSENVLLHADSGEDFVIERADEFDREAAKLGSSDKFMSFLEERSQESGDLTFEDVKKKRGL